MNKLWVGSIYYFLNVILHIGVFGVLFFVSVPDHFTTLDYIAELWHASAVRETIILNSSLLFANFIFALIIMLMTSRSILLLIIMTLIAWAGLCVAFILGTVGLMAYAAGAMHLTLISFNQFKDKTYV